jgi:hypothetical protein
MWTWRCLDSRVESKLRGRHVKHGEFVWSLTVRASNPSNDWGDLLLRRRSLRQDNVAVWDRPGPTGFSASADHWSCISACSVRRRRLSYSKQASVRAADAVLLIASFNVALRASIGWHAVGTRIVGEQPPSLNWGWPGQGRCWMRVNAVLSALWQPWYWWGTLSRRMEDLVIWVRSCVPLRSRVQGRVVLAVKRRPRKFWIHLDF